MPDGTYEFTDWIDDDGIDPDPIPIKVVITVTGDRLIADFEGLPPYQDFRDAVSGSLPCQRQRARSAARAQPWDVGRSRGVEGIGPAESREAGEIGVAGIQLGAVLDRQGSKMRVVDEVAGRPEGPEELTNRGRVAVARVDDDRTGLREPAVDHIECPVGRQWPLEHDAVRAQTRDREEHDPCKAHRVLTRELSLEPGSRRRVAG